MKETEKLMHKIEQLEDELQSLKEDYLITSNQATLAVELIETLIDCQYKELFETNMLYFYLKTYCTEQDRFKVSHYIVREGIKIKNGEKKVSYRIFKQKICEIIHLDDKKDVFQIDIDIDKPLHKLYEEL
ncbi:MAG: hypothetical protein Q4D45_10920 [Lachnospiraceae bacterium]|nr:hypothetical protein [Lachnospiraceae bacterium]